jgi:hypothetical protein
MLQHQEDEENLQGRCGNGEEVDGNDLVDVVVQKRLPSSEREDGLSDEGAVRPCALRA